jgi:uncharacterized protein YecT (DUF1311 family)
MKTIGLWDASRPYVKAAALRVAATPTSFFKAGCHEFHRGIGRVLALNHWASVICDHGRSRTPTLETLMRDLPPRVFRPCALAFAAMVLFASGARADGEYDRCMAEAKGESIAFGECGGALVARAEAELDIVWKRLLDKTPQRSKYALSAEQLAWIAFKGRACDFYSSGDWGREGVVVHTPQCKARIISERTKQLEDLEGQVQR